MVAILSTEIADFPYLRCIFNESNCHNSKVGIYVSIRNLNVELFFENSVKSFQNGK